MLSVIEVVKFNTLIEMSALINSKYTNIQDLLAALTRAAASLCDGDGANLILHNAERKEILFATSLGEGELKPVQYGEGVAGWVARHNKPLALNDRDSDRGRFLSSRVRNILAVPLRVEDVCVGVIQILNKKKDKNFSHEDLEWLEIFANQIGLALRNAPVVEERSLELPTMGYHPLVYKSDVIREKLEIIKQIAKTDASALILGESGVGKELFAERIHQYSARREEAFVRVNCAAIPEGLLESELFGHVKGAFTSAVQDRKGRFELADRGTIFLDEIGDLTLSLQAKLLRVIQSKTFERVGSNETIAVNVRILTATNKDIEAMVASKLFRGDLYYRLNVLPIVIPPLRERPEDIPYLAEYFLKKYQRHSGKGSAGFAPGAMESLLAYSWPGNVRELEHCIEKACVIARGDAITQEDLFEDRYSRFPQGGEGRGSLKQSINAFKAYYIKKVLEEYHWNQTEAARILDIQRTYLSRLIKELEIEIPKET